MKRIVILGSTGSIGVNTIEVIGGHPEEFTVTALAAGTNVELLRRQIDRFRPAVAAVADEEHARRLREMLGPRGSTAVCWGSEGYREAASVGADMAVSAMVGAAGLLPTLAAIESGKQIALANKETLVMAGGIVLRTARERGVSIIPVDSEHSAVFQCLQGHRGEDVRRIILTASGGPFRDCSAEELRTVTPERALRHPNWSMGRKITIDSATMMNKGLEIIEARWLFGLPVSAIDVLIHPQSVVHSLVEYRDGALIAQLGVPDMRIPIAYALSFPRRLAPASPFLDLAGVGTLEFFPPDPVRFPALGIASAAANRGGTMPAVLNAANECAVAAFIDGRIGFLDICTVTKQVLERHCVQDEPEIDAILSADRWAREEAKHIIEGMGN
ncbi:MAG: 1-deoxy-D-xylulose-5-phosphate reductoisomerase [Syntrophales bacterium]